jgi:VWFA-related protein
VFAASVLALGLAGIALRGATQAAPPQDPQNQPRPVFRAGANFVSVDAYPTHNGRVVEGLARDDFEVLEDGKAQKVEEFEFVRGVPDGPDADWPEPTRLEAAEHLAGDSHRRVFVSYLTGYRVSWEAAQNARTATMEFFARSVGPSDLFGILRPYESVVDLVLGERPDVLADEAASYWDWAGQPHPDGWPKSPEEQEIFNCLYGHQGAGDIEALMDLWRRDRILSTLEELAVRLASMREARSNVLIFGGALTFRSSKMPVPALPIGLTPGGTFKQQPEDPCAREFRRLATTDRSRRFEDLVETSRRRGVSFSFIEPAGLSIFDDDIRASHATRVKAVEDRYEQMRILALETGGTSIVAATELGPALQKLAAEQSGHYQLGYYSSNNKFDGKFRAITVKVRKAGVSVLARKGYQAPTAEMLRASEAAAARGTRQTPPPSAAVQAVAELERVSPESRVYGHAARRGDHVVVVAEIASAQLELGRWADGAAVDGRLLGPNQTPAGSAHGSIARGSRAVAIDVPLAEAGRGPWTASVHVTGSGELAVGIDVPATPLKLLGDPLVFRSLMTPNAPLRPVADFAFRRTERLHVEWPVLVPLDQRQARLLDQRGQPLAVNASALETRDGAATTLSADVALAALAAGTYVVEIVVSAAGVAEQRYVAFKVVR